MTESHPLPALVAFDLDDTLAPSKSRMRPAMTRALARLLERTSVAVISGGKFAQFESQLVAALQAEPMVARESFTNLHLLPTCGTRYERFTDGEWRTVYEELLTGDEAQRAIAALEQEAHRLGLWEPEPWGEIIENRGSQITFSALGQRAPIEAKQAWDPDGTKKNLLRSAVADRLPDLEVRSGGSTSVDITRRGIDKAYGMRKLASQTGISLNEMLFIGDRLDPEGNDYPVRALGVDCREVSGWEDTVALVGALLDRAERA